MADDVEGWIGTVRRDTMTIARTMDGAYVILPAEPKKVIVSCPCCGAEIRTLRSAQLIANKVYPMAPEAPR